MKVLLPSGLLVEQNNAAAPEPLFRLAFRPFFLFAALFSIVSLLLWVAHYSGQLHIQPYGGAYWWHMHEMLFGFTAAVIVGFLLTAVQTWTQVPSIKGKPLMALFGLWALARILLLFPQHIAPYLLVALDVLFLPLASGFLARPIIKVKMWRNLMFIPVLLAMTGVNGAMHYLTAAEDSAWLKVAGETMVMLVTLVMCIMGGRVFPMFTANGTQTPRVHAIAWLEKLSILSVLAAVLISTKIIELPNTIAAGIFLTAGVANFLRALRWRIWVTIKTPLVWSLHLSYWAISIGLLMMGLAKMGWVQPSLATHAITVGGMGSIILSMISRVSLGHTGRKIAVGPLMTCAFVSMVLAFVTRAFAPLIVDGYIGLILVTAILWTLAYGCFVVAYTPILTKPRVDGAPG